MSSYTDFFLNSRADAVPLELLEVTHPAFTQAYRIVRNARDGVTVDLPANGALPPEADAFFRYYPARVRKPHASNDLDTSMQIDLGDLGEVLPVEVDAVAAAGAFRIKPTVRFWIYRSDDLTQPVFGPINLEAGQLNHSQDGVTFEAKAPSLNSNRTGMLYRLETFPMLRGTL